MSVSEFILLFLIFLVVYPYVIYPLIVMGIHYVCKPKPCQQEFEGPWPYVSCIISVFNEEAVIREKLNTLLQSDYPADRLQVFIGSDGSNDSSNAIIDEVSKNDARVVPIFFSNRSGKTSVINALTNKILAIRPASSDHVLIYTDANIYLEPQTLKRLVRGFSKADIAVIDTRIIQRSKGDRGISGTERNYIQLESKLKWMEGRLWGMAMGAFGGCYAVRSNDGCTLPDGLLVDDFYITMQAMMQGGKSITEPSAICFEDITDHMMEEFRRKRRIAAGNFQNLRIFMGRIHQMKFTLAFVFFSHKVLRWLVPVNALIAFAMAWVFSLTSHPQLYPWICCITFILVVMPSIDWIFSKFEIKMQVLRSWSYFLFMNLAVLMGLFRYLQGIQQGTWQPPKRTLNQ